MATLKSVIEYVDSVKPNAFTNDVKTAWLNEVEGLVQTEVLLRAIDEVEEYTWAEDQDTELLVRPPHDKLYRAYLTAMVDFANGEYNRYANTMEMFNAHFGEFQRWFAHVYRPADTHGDVYADAGTLIDTEWRGYYITAYGIAVKHGYQGTEAEWLEMLYGRAEEAAERAEEAADGLEEFVEQAREELSADRTVTWNPAMILDANAGTPEEMTLSFTPAAGSAPTISNPTTLQMSWDGLRVAIDETVTGDASVGTFIGLPEGTSGGTVDLVSKTVTRDAWVVVRLEVENDVIVARTTGTAGSYGYDTTNKRILITNMAPQAIAANAESTLCSHSTSVKTKHNQVSTGQDGDYCASGGTITYKFADGEAAAETFIKAQYNAGHPLAFAYLRSEGTEAEPLEMEDVALHKGTNRVEAVVTQTGSGTEGEQIPRSHGQMRLTYSRNLGLEHLETAYGVDTTITTFDEVWTNQQTGTIQGATVYLVEVPKRNLDGSYNHVFLQCAAITRDSSGNPVSATPKKPSEWAEELNAPIVMNAGLADYNSGSGTHLPWGPVIQNGVSLLENEYTSAHRSHERTASAYHYMLGVRADGSFGYYQTRSLQADKCLIDGVVQMCGAYGPIISGGEQVLQKRLDEYSDILAPRNVLGFAEDRYVILTTSGRHGADVDEGGIRLERAAEILLGMGVQEAYLMDGGGSVSTVVAGEKINLDIDDGGERSATTVWYIKKVDAGAETNGNALQAFMDRAKGETTIPGKRTSWDEDEP